MKHFNLPDDCQCVERPYRCEDCGKQSCDDTEFVFGGDSCCLCLRCAPKCAECNRLDKLVEFDDAWLCEYCLGVENAEE